MLAIDQLEMLWLAIAPAEPHHFHRSTAITKAPGTTPNSESTAFARSVELKRGPRTEGAAESIRQIFSPGQMKSKPGSLAYVVQRYPPHPSKGWCVRV